MSCSETMEPGPKFQGSLEKQARIPRTWKKYWFILKDDLLTYVKNQDKTISSGQIEMANVQSVRKVNAKYGYQFEIVTKSKTHYLSAATSELRDKWISVLHESMAWYGRRPSTASSVSSSRTSSGTNFTDRASCNSVSEVSDKDTTIPVSSSFLPNHRSSGYHSTGSRISDNVNGQRESSTRDSGTEDLMFTNQNYVTQESTESATDGSRLSKHVCLRRLAAPPRQPYSTISIDPCPSGTYDSVFLDEPIDLSSIDEGYVNVRKQQQQQPQPQAEPGKSSDIYQSVHESANIAISHIVQGYADIKRNTGPELDGNGSDDVNDERRSGADGSVVMRSSMTSRTSDAARSGQQTNDLDDDSQTTKPTSGLARDSGSTAGGVFRFSGFAPVCDLPHPRRELTYRTCFDDIRQFLASNRGPDDYYTAVNRNQLDGRHVKALKDYLAAHC